MVLRIQHFGPYPRASFNFRSQLDTLKLSFFSRLIFTFFVGIYVLNKKVLKDNSVSLKMVELYVEQNAIELK